MDGYAVRAADLGRDPDRASRRRRDRRRVQTDPAPLPAGSAVRDHDRRPDSRGCRRRRPDRRHAARRRRRSRSLRGRDAGDYVREAGSDVAGGRGSAAGRAAPRVPASGRPRRGEPPGRRRALARAASRSSAPAMSSSRPARRWSLVASPTANGIALATAAIAVGAEVVDLQITGDDPARLRATLERAIANGAELILTSGGISMGAHEPVRQLLEPLGATVGTVDMQPGGPQAHGRYRDVPVVCFPGNPVSTPAELRAVRRARSARDRRAAGRGAHVAPAGRATGVPRRAPAVPPRAAHGRRRRRDRRRARARTSWPRSPRLTS